MTIVGSQDSRFLGQLSTRCEKKDQKIRKAVCKPQFDFLFVSRTAIGYAAGPIASREKKKLGFAF